MAIEMGIPEHQPMVTLFRVLLPPGLPAMAAQFPLAFQQYEQCACTTQLGFTGRLFDSERVPQIERTNNRNVAARFWSIRSLFVD